MKDGKPTNWCVLGFKDKKAAKLKVLFSGEGGLDALLPNLDDGAVMFGAFRVTGVDERGGVTSRRSKFVSFSWAGPQVPVMMKSKVSVYRTKVKELFTGSHLFFQIGNKVGRAALSHAASPPSPRRRAARTIGLRRSLAAARSQHPTHPPAPPRPVCRAS